MEGFVYRFESVMKDFAYAPPGRRAVIVALERTPTGVVQPPVILDAVFNALKGVNLDFSHYDGALAPDRFLKCFAGDPAAIRALGLEKDTVYLVMALNECAQTNQIVAQGKAMNMLEGSDERRPSESSASRREGPLLGELPTSGAGQHGRQGSARRPGESRAGNADDARGPTRRDQAALAGGK